MYTSLDELYKEIYTCDKCELCKQGNAVPGVGDPKAKLMFIGEAPGEHEQRTGFPFVGRAGELLTKMIHAMGLTRQRVYITNILKHRPPGNRDPLKPEVQACESYLFEQIRLIDPKIICVLGKPAMKLLLHTNEAISKERGIWRDYHGRSLIVTYHPAYLLRDPTKKQIVWEDLQKIMKLYHFVF